MEAKDWLSILAIVLSPLFALEVQKRIASFKEKRQRKIYLFYTLMSTRAARVSQRHVEALNGIDIEFSSKKKKEKSVIAAWRIYRDHLNNRVGPEELKNWGQKGDDLFADLLCEMSKSLGYSFDKVDIKKGIYAPQAHFDQEQSLNVIRENLVKILEGKQALPMQIVAVPLTKEAIAKQEQVQTKLLEYLDGNRVAKVKVVEEPEKEKT